MSKHTPGPWEAEGPEQFYGEAVCDLNNGWRVVTLKADPNEYEPEADAKLIAAAPELLEALEKCVFLLGSIGHRPNNSATAMVAFDAIAKAKGEQE